MTSDLTVLGLGPMGTALAHAQLAAGRAVTVWNRTPGREVGLLAAGAVGAATPAAALSSSDLLVLCLYDADSVREVLAGASLSGRTVVNLTTVTPAGARALAAEVAAAGGRYLAGAIMAVPDLIGGPHASLLYSGPRDTFDRLRDVLLPWGDVSYEGEDPGAAALLDFAMLSAMYVMFAGFLHGAAMVATDGVDLRAFANRATTFLAAMTPSFDGLAALAAAGRYDEAGEQSLAWTDLDRMVAVSDEQHVDSSPIAMVAALARRQIDAGHGAAAFARIYESLRVS